MFKRSTHPQLTWPIWLLSDATADLGVLIESTQQCWGSGTIKGMIMVPTGPLPDQLLIR